MQAQEVFVAELLPVEGLMPSSSSARATFRIAPTRNRIEFELVAHNVEEINGAHLHIWASRVTAAGVLYDFNAQDHEGPIVAFLMPFNAKGVRGEGLVASGAITLANLIGDHNKLPFSSLIDHMKNGHLYVALHVRQHFETGDVFCCPSGLRGIVRPALPQ